VVLVVDDPGITALVRKVLERAGHAIDICGGGAEGVERLARGPRPHAVVLDLALPDLDALSVLRLVRSDARTADLPVLALSGSPLLGDRERALGAGADGLLAKPFEILELQRSVAELAA
jgi:CheY-like chemotaxis protein